jgi:hypothetical protein
LAAALTGSDPELELPAELVERIREVVAERCRVEGLISAVERERSDVKEDIYLKVRSDYEGQLQAVLHAYEPLKIDAQNELARLREKEADLEVSLAKVEDELSELRFRCRVGEFAEDELARAEKSRLTEVAKCETRLERLRSTFSLADSLLGDDAKASVRVSAPVPAPFQAPAPAEEPMQRVAPAPSAPTPTAPAPAPVPARQAGAEAAAEDSYDSLVGTEDSGPSPTLPPTAERSEATLAPVSLAPVAVDPPVPAAGVAGVPTNPCLVLLTSEGEEIYPVGPSGVSLGRSKTNHIVLAEPGVSRRHAVIGWQDGEVVIEDQSSGGGVVLNGQFVERAVLRPGDIIQVVSFQLRYVAD